MTHVTHVNGWEPAVYMSCMSQNFRLFLVSNLSVLNFRIFLLMYPGSPSPPAVLGNSQSKVGPLMVWPASQTPTASASGLHASRLCQVSSAADGDGVACIEVAPCYLLAGNIKILRAARILVKVLSKGREEHAHSLLCCCTDGGIYIVNTGFNSHTWPELSVCPSLTVGVDQRDAAELLVVAQNLPQLPVADAVPNILHLPYHDVLHVYWVRI